MEDESYLIPVYTEILNEKPYVSRISQYLFDTLTKTDGGTFRSVVDGLDHMEQLPFSRSPRTKPATSFDGPILGSLCKFHYTTNMFMKKNILMHWDSRANRAVRAQVNELYDNAVGSNKSPEELWQIAGEISGRVTGGYGVRADAHKLTGEWVIYAVSGGQNYYLALGVHSELKDEQALFDRVRSGCPEFPFCFDEKLAEKSE